MVNAFLIEKRFIYSQGINFIFYQIRLTFDIKKFRKSMKIKYSFLFSVIFFLGVIYVAHGQSQDQNYIKSTEYLETVLTEDDFISSFGGWLENGSVNYSLENGRLKANVNTSWEGIKKPLSSFKTIAGKTLKIKIVFDKGNTSSNIRLYLEERNPSEELVSYNIKDSNLQSGTHNYTHTMNHSGNSLIFRIDKDNTNTSVETYFHVDYISLKVGTESAIEKLESVTYFDGFGKAKQSIAIKQSPNQKDLIQHIEYDQFGRTSKQYLPSPSSQNTGNYISNAKTLTENYYQNAFADQHPFSEIRYDNSPLNRKLETSAPGNTWQLLSSSDDDHTTKYDYQTNSTNEVYKIEINEQSATKPLDFSYYPSRQLLKNSIKNENWTSGDGLLNTAETFTDKNGRKVAEFTYELDGTSIKKLSTYYVYDNSGNLRYLLTPLAFEKGLSPETTPIDSDLIFDDTLSNGETLNLTATSSITLKPGTNIKAGAFFNVKIVNNEYAQPEILSELCYEYKYDDFNRQIEQKVPGKDWEYMVYDQLDRPILTQDANLRAQNKWLFNKYDVYGRVVYSGLYTSSSNRQALQNQADNFINDSSNKANIVSRTTTINTIGGISINYSNGSYPSSNLEVLNVNYYDDYNFTDANLPTIPTEILEQKVTTRTKGLLTASWTKTLGSSSWAKDYTFYDEKGRTIYVHDKNHLGGYTQNKSKLDFRGKIEESVTTHKRVASSLALTIEDTFEYDHAERPLKHFQKINSQAQELIASNSYNELGQLSSKSVGGSASNQLQTIDYQYNIRGWVTQMNDVNNLGQDLFGYSLNYDGATEGSASVGNNYNGNIKQVIWKSALNNVKKSYAFEYDKLNRFIRSYYREGNALTSGSGKFETANLGYDANGNIKTLTRKNHSGSLMDNLVYHYDVGNQLKSIVDTSGSQGFNNGTTGSSETDYTYDTNGNLIKDLNKNITNIEYNHLDLVERVTFSNGNKIEFDYDASGSKLQMRNILASGSTTTVDYLGGFQYTNAQLEFFPTPEGYAAKNGSIFSYVYIYRDHLGNSRLSFSDNNGNLDVDASEILSNTDYYVMGLTHNGEFIAGVASNYNYKYQGKEQLAFSGYSMYDFGSRMYDAAVGRWFNTDPQNQFHSPYLAMGNNHIMMVDPNGELALGLYFRALSFVGDFISNVVNGKSDALGTAWENSTNAYEGMSSALTIPIAQGDDFNASIGINPFCLCISANASVKVGNWRFSRSGGYGHFNGGFVSGGTSFDDGTHSFGVSAQAGENHYGIGGFYKYKETGLGYHSTKYGDAIGPDGVANPQTVGGLTYYSNHFSFRIENDFLAFKDQDRWRSNAIEISYKDFMIGTTLYNNNRQEGDPVIKGKYSHAKGKYGRWVDGQTYSSPVYFGFRSGNTIERIGYSHRAIQNALQNNMVHKKGLLWGLFPIGKANYFLDYKYFDRGIYLYSGWNNPFSLWGK